MERFIAGAVLFGFAACSPAFAQQGPCADDNAKFCKDVQPGQGRIVKCIKGYENELSMGCKTHLAEMKQKVGEAWEIYSYDVSKFCSGVQPGEDRIMRCLKEHENDLTPQCKTRMRERRQERSQQISSLGPRPDCRCTETQVRLLKAPTSAAV